MAKGYFPCISLCEHRTGKEVERGAPEGPGEEQNSKREEEQMSQK